MTAPRPVYYPGYRPNYFYNYGQYGYAPGPGVTYYSILGGMNERQIGAILAAMTKDRAAALTKLLAAES